ncbi:Kinesin-related protein 1 [Lamellibrachia satsuma]|nr:Kinesin-related protein 1 [Lamellibrachia satsuma]
MCSSIGDIIIAIMIDVVNRTVFLPHGHSCSLIMTSVENVKVAVRVRPFNRRELSRNAQLVVEMDNATTMLIDPSNPKAAPKKFTYDFSYWSHDGFKVRQDGYHEKNTDKYVDQVKVFTDLGLGMLSNAWAGYNCSIFAYGQTGSGKSYSIMGHGTNLGLVPRTCEQLFKDIDSRKEAGMSYEVTFSMLEIYNEQARDLLNKKKTPHGGLRVKESPERGFYVEGLTIVPVGTYSDIKLRMNEGDRQRTIASTKMNETSSRAHTIVTITFAQNCIRTKTTKMSSINLVDLAGSERAKQTESTGDRFEEAKNINRSLMTLGSVIKALCDKARGVNTHVPYRDSVLTKLLKNTLGGNSKSVMIAAISPDAENYDQSLSTLKYADRAKSIRTVAKVNQEATNKLIQDLIAEKEKLLRELENARTATAHGYTDDGKLPTS